MVRKQRLDSLRTGSYPGLKVVLWRYCADRSARYRSHAVVNVEAEKRDIERSIVLRFLAMQAARSRLRSRRHVGCDQQGTCAGPTW